MDKAVVSARQGGMHERVWVAGGKCGGLSVAEPLPLGMCQAWNFVGEMVCSRVEVFGLRETFALRCGSLFRRRVKIAL